MDFVQQHAQLVLANAKIREGIENLATLSSALGEAAADADGASPTRAPAATGRGRRGSISEDALAQYRDANEVALQRILQRDGAAIEALKDIMVRARGAGWAAHLRSCLFPSVRVLLACYRLPADAGHRPRGDDHDVARAVIASCPRRCVPSWCPTRGFQAARRPPRVVPRRCVADQHRWRRQHCRFRWSRRDGGSSSRRLTGRGCCIRPAGTQPNGFADQPLAIAPSNAASACWRQRRCSVACAGSRGSALTQQYCQCC